jgi:cell filamentation protein, protein adenylyltransferase
MQADLPSWTTIADGNGRMGRLWQTLIVSCWNSLFANIPVERLVNKHQIGYRQALQDSTDATDAAPFIAFMLEMISGAMSSVTPQIH